MKLALKDFQEDAVSSLVKYILQAKRDVRDGDSQAVVLASPTGSGKTVIIASAMEEIVSGSDKITAEPDAVFLWLSDQPELNVQSRNKIIAASSRFRESDLIVVNGSFDQETFDGGKIYFLNTQKLGKDKSLVTKGDKRTYTIWETIRNTEEKIRDRFYLIIDEAHRGMNISDTERRAAETIVQKFVLGEPGTLSPVKMIIGISATPERFQKVLQGMRTVRNCNVSPDDVRKSGLLKDQIVLYHPKEEMSSDWSLLAEAARKCAKAKDEWDTYCDSQGISRIQPAMVIQVQDGNNEGVLTRTSLQTAIETLEGAVGVISDEEMAHSFQEDTAIEVGGRKIQKIDASRIQDETGVRFIFFKMSLNTGWDCPRAEVMMSFRTASDYTNIAQLIGRMVRTPLARRIEGNEFLNTVSLYLPHFNAGNLQRVVDHLKSDPENVPPSDITVGDRIIPLVKRTGCEPIFNALDGLPTYHIDSARKTSNTKRLMRLSHLLTSIHGINEKALDNSKTLVVKTLEAEIDRVRKADPTFDEKITRRGEIEIQPVVVEQGTWKAVPGVTELVVLSKANIEELYERAGQRLGEGLHRAYFKEHFDPEDPDKSKIELFLILQFQEVWGNLENICKSQIDTLFNNHRVAIRKRSSSEKEKYNVIRESAKEPEKIEFCPPEKILAPKVDGGREYDRHLYVGEDGKFREDLNTWEDATISAEIPRRNVVGWIRNYERRNWALSIPYERDGEMKSMYPDFLVVRKERDGFVVDILEPHRPDLEDNWMKAKGLAVYAKKHGDQYGRIEFIRVAGGVLKRLDVNEETNRRKIRKVSSNAHLNQLFDDI